MTWFCTSPCGERGRAFRHDRHGGRVELNPIHDRGTPFGLQSRGRTEFMLLSLPRQAGWRCDRRPDPGMPEAEPCEVFLKSQDWV